jgi:hypothetical protein
MCVIIDRMPKVEIPFAKLEIACDINKHGFGLAFVDRGRLEIIRSTKQPNDPDEVQKHLEKLKNHRVFLHLRHATVGTVSEENQHPFVSMTGRKNSALMGFMHNGTLYAYEPRDKTQGGSDTKQFNDQLIRPLALRCRKVVGDKKVLNDPFFQWIVGKELGYTQSVLVFFDAFGNVIRFNEDKGVKFEGWWASNNYSFSESHARATKKDTPAQGWHQREAEHWRGQNRNNPQSYDYGRGDSLKNLPWMTSTEESYGLADWEDEFIKQEGGTPSTPTVKFLEPPKTKQNETRKKWEIEKMSALVKSAETVDKGVLEKKVGGYVIRNEKVPRDPFIQQAGLSSLDQVGLFSEADLIECATNWPQATAALIVDLLYSRHSLKGEARGLKEALKFSEEKNRSLEVRLGNQADLIKTLRTEDVL